MKWTVASLVLICFLQCVKCQNTNCFRLSGDLTSDSPLPLTLTTECFGQQYKAVEEGYIATVNLLLNATQTSLLHVEIYSTLTGTSLGASNSVANPSNGLVSFQFPTYVYQAPNTIYYIRLRYSGTPPIWFATATGTLGNCFSNFCNSTVSCSLRLSYQVSYLVQNCCSPGCFNGGTCEANTTCSCVSPYLGDSCQCLYGMHMSNGTCVPDQCTSPYGDCSNLCPRYHGWSGSIFGSQPLTNSYHDPAQTYVPPDSGYPYAVSMYIVTYNSGTGPLYMNVIDMDSNIILATSFNVTINGGNWYNFTFPTVWSQVAGKTYILHVIVPDLNQQDYGLAMAGSGPFANECIYEVSDQKYQCSSRTLFNVYYNTINCCSPSCVHNGTCQSNGICQCTFPYSGSGCINKNECKVVSLNCTTVGSVNATCYDPDMTVDNNYYCSCADTRYTYNSTSLLCTYDECLMPDACEYVHGYCLDSDWTTTGTTLQCCPEGWNMINGTCQPSFVCGSNCDSSCTQNYGQTNLSTIKTLTSDNITCLGQEYKAVADGYVSSIDLYVSTNNVSSSPVAIEIYQSISKSIPTRIARSTPITNGNGTITFQFPTPWYQIKTYTYYIYLDDPSSLFTYHASYPMAAGDPQLNGECTANLCTGTRDCTSRLYFNIHYEYVHCCTPCYGGSYCSQQGTCECSQGYYYASQTCMILGPATSTSTTTTSTSTIGTTSTSGTSSSSTISSTTSSTVTTTTTGDVTSTTESNTTSSQILTSAHIDNGNVGAIVGGSIGGALVIAALVGFFLIYMRRRKSKNQPKDEVKPDEIPMDRVTTSEVKELQDVRIGKKLGEGNFGEVFLGTWAGTDVALKKLSGGEITAFEQEASILCSLTHPNVVRLLGLYHNSRTGESYMVMEYVALGSLHTLLRKASKLTYNDKLDMIISACKGMVYLETKNIIHRDISARNLLVTKENDKYVCKISDFGLSRNTQSYSSEGKIMPVRWAAPEILKEQACTIKGDVWSFGIAIWEILEVDLPYPDMKKNKEVIQFVLEGGRLPQPDACPDVLYKLMTKMWAADPDDRPAFSDVLEKLKDLVVETNESKTNYSDIYALTEEDRNRSVQYQ